VKKILLELLALLWKFLRTFVLQWLKSFFGKFALWGTLILIAGLVGLVLFVVLLSNC
jgi:hypothetical protein